MAMMSMKVSTIIVKSIPSGPGVQAQGRCQYCHVVENYLILTNLFYSQIYLRKNNCMAMVFMESSTT